jgi:hypothetical protein
MNKQELKYYINDRIHNKIYSKIHHHEYEANYYFKNRHKGLAGIDEEQTAGLAFNAIRNLRVWKEIRLLCNSEEQLTT